MPQLQQRIRHEFDVLGLADRYAVVSGPDLTKIGRRVAVLSESGGKDAILAHLLEMADDCWSNGPNSRRAVVYEALSRSDRHCSGGYAA